MKKYIKKYITRDWLYSNNFRYNRMYSTDKEAVYSQRFIVSRYLGIPILECEILVYYPEGLVQVNVYKAGTREKYPAFYDRDYGKNKSVDAIDNKISKKLKKLNIEVVEDGNDNN